MPSSEYNTSPAPYATPQTESRGRGNNHGVPQKRGRSYPSSSDDGESSASADSGFGSRRNDRETPTPVSPSSRHTSSRRRSSISHRASQSAPPKKRRGHAAGSSPDRNRSPAAPAIAYRWQANEEVSRSPPPGASPEEVDEAIWRTIQTSIAEDEYWIDFMKSKAIPQPLPVSETLQQYRFVQRKVNEWEGRLAPFKSSHHLVEKVFYYFCWTVIRFLTTPF